MDTNSVLFIAGIATIIGSNINKKLFWSKLVLLTTIPWLVLYTTTASRQWAAELSGVKVLIYALAYACIQFIITRSETRNPEEFKSQSIYINRWKFHLKNITNNIIIGLPGLVFFILFWQLDGLNILTPMDNMAY